MVWVGGGQRENGSGRVSEKAGQYGVWLTFALVSS